MQKYMVMSQFDDTKQTKYTTRVSLLSLGRNDDPWKNVNCWSPAISRDHARVAGSHITCKSIVSGFRLSRIAKPFGFGADGIFSSIPIFLWNTLDQTRPRIIRDVLEMEEKNEIRLSRETEEIFFWKLSDTQIVLSASGQCLETAWSSVYVWAGTPWAGWDNDSTSNHLQH